MDETVASLVVVAFLVVVAAVSVDLEAKDREDVKSVTNGPTAAFR